MPSVSLARFLMATRFEAVLSGDDAARLRAAGEEALDEIEALEGLLSAFRPASDIARLNAAGGRWERVDPRVYALLSECADLSAATEGAFDITIGPLLHAWGFFGGGGAWPSEADVSRARDLVGCRHLQFDADASAVRLDAGASVDLGAVGKGYAVDAAVHVLREAGVRSALLHGGTSTAKAVGGGFRIEVAAPGEEASAATVTLDDGWSLSVSAGHGKAFSGPDGAAYGHVLDPRSGRPVAASRLAAVVAPSATLSDALSTALLVLGPRGLESVIANWPAASALVVPASGPAVASGTAFNLAGVAGQHR